ncbi:MAG TPA: helix-turn-helix domain-containing protein [Roseiflexaceae bacterium]|nr:helix-turn-helix domain-containing protein [Roseiflexaceae bacterium]
MDGTMSFGTWLRRCRMTRGLTQRAFARHLGYAFSTYRKMEADERRPSSAFLDTLADYIAISGAARTSLLAFGKTGECHQPDTLLQYSLPLRPQEPPARPSGRPLRFPLPPTPLIGREREQAELLGMLRQPQRRLVTLLGPPGVGKTHLALHALADLAATNEFADGIVFVPLTAQATPHDACAAIARALAPSPGEPLPQQLLSALLGDQRLLLALDTLEHLPALGPMLAELLGVCPRLTILATSRAPLRVRAEQQFAVAPLALPDPAQISDPELLGAAPAVALFVARAQAVQRSFLLTHANSATVAALCARLDGLPLAIELAAAHSKLLPPAALLESLGDRLDLLTDGPRDLPMSHQSLRAAIERSYLLLTPAQQRLFARLGVFVDSAAFAAVKAVCADEDGPRIAHTLTQLMDHHLVWAIAGEPQRVQLLETLRAYAQEQLAARGEDEPMRERHAVYYTEWGQEQAARIRSSDRVGIMQELEQELGNLRAALEWCLAHPCYVQAGARLAASLCPFWWGYGYLREGRAWLERAVLALEQRGCGHTRALGHPLPAEQLPPTDLYAHTLCALGGLATLQGDYARAQSVLHLSLNVWNGLTEPYGTAEALYWLGVAAHHQGDNAAAERYCQDSLVQFRSARANQRIAAVCFELGFLQVEHQCDLPQANLLFQESLSHAHASSDDPMAVADARFGLGLAAYLAGDDQQVLSWLDRGVLHDLLSCDRRRCVQALQLLGGVLCRTADPRLAVQTWSAAARAGERMGLRLPAAYQNLYDQALQHTRALLGKAAFADAWAAGHTLSLGDAVDEIAAALAQSVYA